MGNCLRTSNGNKEQEAQMELITQRITFAPKKSELDTDAKKKNRVRFVLQEDHGEEDGDGERNNRNDREDKSNVVRIRMVVTVEELKQILDRKTSGSKFSSVEQLLSELKLRGRSILEVEKKCVDNGNWSPTLERIVEDHY